MIRARNPWEKIKRFLTFSPAEQQEPSADESQEPAPEDAPDLHTPDPNTPEWKKQVLSDFSDWLDALPDEAPPAEKATLDSCDLYTLLSEFSALRQEIRYQNREQNRTTASLAAMQEGYERSLSVFEKSIEGIETLASDIRHDAENKTVGGFFDVRDALVRGHAACRDVISGRRWYRPAPRGIHAIAEGYEMAIRHFDRALSRVGVVAIETVGRPFDPKRMKAVGRQSDPQQGTGIVVAEETSGFIRGSDVLRTPEVIVNAGPGDSAYENAQNPAKQES